MEGKLKNLCTLSSAFPEIFKYYITSRLISFSENGYFSMFPGWQEETEKGNPAGNERSVCQLMVNVSLFQLKSPHV